MVEDRETWNDLGRGRRRGWRRWRAIGSKGQQWAGTVGGGLREVSRGWNQLTAFLVGLSCVLAITEHGLNVTCVRAATSLLSHAKQKTHEGIKGGATLRKTFGAESTQKIMVFLAS